MFQFAAMLLRGSPCGFDIRCLSVAKTCSIGFSSGLRHLLGQTVSPTHSDFLHVHDP